MYERISEVIVREGMEVDFLDMNLGCPIDLICNSGAGAKLMQRERSLGDAIEGMSKNLQCPITIKISYRSYHEYTRGLFSYSHK